MPGTCVPRSVPVRRVSHFEHRMILRDLFPGVDLPRDVAVMARADNGVTLLAGTTFIFNERGEPSMAKPFPVP